MVIEKTESATYRNLLKLQFGMCLRMVSNESGNSVELAGLDLAIAGSDVFQARVNSIKKPMRAEHFRLSPDHDDEANLDLGCDLRFLLAEVFAAGALYGRIFDVKDILIDCQ